MTSRRTRDALVALLVSLGPFAYTELLAGNHATAGLTLAVMAGIAAVYRYADARVIETVADTDAEELKPVLRRIGRRLRTGIDRARNRSR